jgi:uncharacterized membrane protein YjgN (DUF898 family)
MVDTQSPPPPPPQRSIGESVRHSFSFTGSPLEYFSVWIVNVALTIITLGLYSPWAKVRRERYLTSHTELAGVQFEYTADAWKIFKGRVLLIAALIVIAIARAIPTIWILIVFPLFALGWPWVIASALRFRARYTSYRNLSFHFVGAAGGAFAHCVVPKVIAVMTLWLLAPWAQLSSKRYSVNNLQYGVTSFQTLVTFGQVYQVYALAAILLVLGILLTGCGIGVAGISSAALESGDLSLLSVPRLVIAASLFCGGLGLIACTPGYIRLGVARRVWDGATIGTCSISWTPSMGRYLAIAITNTLLRSVTLGLASPWCVVRVRKFLVENLAVIGPQSLDDFVGQRRAEIRSIGEQAAEMYDLDVDFGF